MTKITAKHLGTGVFIAITLDLWTDDVKKVSFLSVTVHYIDEEFVLFDRTLHVKPVHDANHTAIMVLEELSEALAVFDVFDSVFDQITVVADGGSNIVGEGGVDSEFDL